MKSKFKIICALLLALSLASCTITAPTDNTQSTISNTSSKPSSSSNISSNTQSNNSSSSNTDNTSSKPKSRYTSEFLKNHEHEWGIWVIEVEPEPNKPGTAKRTCKICRIQKTEEITMEDLYDFHSQFGLQYSQ